MTYDIVLLLWCDVLWKGTFVPWLEQAVYSRCGNDNLRRRLTCVYGVMEANWVCNSSSWINSGLFLAASATSWMYLTSSRKRKPFNTLAWVHHSVHNVCMCGCTSKYLSNDSIRNFLCIFFLHILTDFEAQQMTSTVHSLCLCSNIQRVLALKAIWGQVNDTFQSITGVV